VVQLISLPLQQYIDTPLDVTGDLETPSAHLNFGGRTRRKKKRGKRRKKEGQEEKEDEEEGSNKVMWWGQMWRQL
jgi:hypothetical protein